VEATQEFIELGFSALAVAARVLNRALEVLKVVDRALLVVREPRMLFVVFHALS
jgi:hypothetical protein